MRANNYMLVITIGIYGSAIVIFIHYRRNLSVP